MVTIIKTITTCHIFRHNSHSTFSTRTPMPSHNQEMNLLLLSSDAKPRLKWTPELHQRFVGAVKQLGGPQKATPKSLMRIMGIHGLTLYHLKSHLQKYRLGRTQRSQTYHHNKQEDIAENQRSNSMSSADEEKTNDVQAVQALETQMNVQRKILHQIEVQRHLQIEVQRHLQLRIEAQWKYLQTVLKKAQETLSGCRACSIEVERARAQLSQLASMVDSESCVTSSEERKSCMDETEESGVKKNIDLNALESGIDLNSNTLQLFGSTF